MTWEPLAPADQRPAIAARIRALVAEMPPPLHLSERCDRALVRSYLAADDLVPDPDDDGSASLEAALAALVGGGVVGTALSGGTANIGWCVAHLAGDEAVAELATLIDPGITASVPATSAYEHLYGIVGLGTYALERGEAGRPLAAAIVDELARRSSERGAGRAWVTTQEDIPPTYGTWPHGMYNLGIAHGITGAIAFLARCVGRGIDRAAPLLDAGMAYLLGANPPRAGGRFRHWETDEPSARLAWCYGDLGNSLAILAAARARQNSEWEATARELARDCAARSGPDVRITEPTLCHGAFGAMHIFARLHHAIGDATLADAARHWLAAGLAMTDYPREASFITGPGGMALALQSMIAPVEPAWDRLLLADVS